MGLLVMEAQEALVSELQDIQVVEAVLLFIQALDDKLELAEGALQDQAGLVLMADQLLVVQLQQMLELAEAVQITERSVAPQIIIAPLVLAVLGELALMAVTEGMETHSILQLTIIMVGLALAFLVL